MQLRLPMLAACADVLPEVSVSEYSDGKEGYYSITKPLLLYFTLPVHVARAWIPIVSQSDGKK